MDTFFHEHYKSASIQNLVKAIVDKAKAEKDIKQLRFMQLLSGVQVIEGVPFDISEHGGTTFVSVYHHSSQQKEADIVVIALDRITSVRIPFNEFYKELLLKSGPWSQNLDDAPTRLTIERKGAELEQTWKKKVQFSWNGADADPAARFYVHKTVLTAEKLFVDLLKDTIGKEALDAINTVHFQFQPADTLHVQSASGVLNIKVGLSLDLNKLELTLNNEFNKNL